MKFKKTTLKNGLRIITAPQPGNLAVTVLVLVEAGSKYETDDADGYNRGVSHFLEHMCFKGTKKRKRALDVSNDLDGLGAAYNAFTGHEYTGFWAKVQAKDFDKALDIISDIYLNPTLPEKDIEKEKGVVTEEINMDEDDAQHKVSNLFFELLYGSQPAGWSIAAKKEDIRRLTREDIVKYRKAHYVADSTVVVVAGAIDEQTTIEKIKKKFHNISVAPKAGKLKVVESQTEPRLHLKYKDSDQTHMILGFRTFPVTDPRRNVLEVIAHLMGGGMSSRLFELLRNKLGAAYYVSAGNDFYTDHGYFAVNTGIDKFRINEVIKGILDECEDLSQKLVTKTELEKIKNSLISSIILGLETSNSLASFYGNQEIFEKKIYRPEEVIEQIKSIQAEDLRSAARDIFRRESLNVAILGPIKDDAPIREFVKSAFKNGRKA